MSSLFPTVVEITKDTPNFSERLEELTKLFSLAFSSPPDPWALPATGGKYEDKPDVHHAHFRAQLQAAFTGAGRVFGAFINQDGVERLAGASVWYTPGREFLDSHDQLTFWASFMDSLDPQTRQWWKDVLLPGFEDLTNEGLGEGIKKGLLHLQLLGVHPDFHRRGLGKALNENLHSFMQSDPTGVASCIETAKATNVLFYGSLGYEVKSKKVFPSPHGDCPMWCLRREPNTEKGLIRN
ncbi:hypothetical protein FRC11_008474 [Ceratobasidium sp. 423]|nr:hypothetical protein FRC11_008474 [Ceratobasidium sp. 423]